MATLLKPVSSGGARLFVLLLAALALFTGPALPQHTNPQSSLVSNTLLQFTSQGHVLGFRPGEFYVSNGTYALRVEFVNAQPVAPASDTASAEGGLGALPLSQVMYANLWEGITLTYDASRGLATSTYRLEPQVDPHAIQLRYNAPVTLSPDGTLSIAYATGRMTESAPAAWQEVAGEHVPVSVAFESRGANEVGFAAGVYDTNRPLFIDPTFTWNAFLGGSGTDYGEAVAVHGNGNVYIAGQSGAWGTPVRAHTSGLDAFVAKIDRMSYLYLPLLMR